VVAAPLVTVSLLVDWRLSLWTIALGAAATTAYTWIAARGTDMPKAGGDDTDFIAGALSEWRVVLTALALTGAAVFVWQGIFNFYDLYMQSKGLSRSASGAMLTIVFASGVPAFYLGGGLADRLPHVPYLLGIVSAFAASILLVTAAEGLLALAVVSAIIGFVVHALFPATDTYVLDALPDSARGSGLRRVQFDLDADAVGRLLGGRAADRGRLRLRRGVQRRGGVSVRVGRRPRGPRSRGGVREMSYRCRHRQPEDPRKPGGLRRRVDAVTGSGVSGSSTRRSQIRSVARTRPRASVEVTPRIGR